ncbi:MAG: hypothetical protein ACERLG_07385 [Sedimentibacter sp.]
MDKLFKRNLNKLKNTLEELDNSQSPTYYNITENFRVNGERNYQVINLNFDQEAGGLWFGDALDEMLKDISYVLNGFLIESMDQLELISLKPLQARFTFMDGFILINQVVDANE